MTTLKCEVRIGNGTRTCPFSVVTETPAEAMLVHQAHVHRMHPPRKPA